MKKKSTVYDNVPKKKTKLFGHIRFLINPNSTKDKPLMEVSA